MTHVLQVEHLSKNFNTFQALHDVSLNFDAGKTVAIVGQNGAGKSTLINVISGLLTADEGHILMDGRNVHIRSPKEAAQLGIRAVHQELSVAANLSVAETIALGERDNQYRLHGKALQERIKKEFQTLLGIEMDPNQLLRNLSTAEIKLVQIAKALFHGTVRVLILDEPTAPLSHDETKVLFQALRTLKRSGTTIIYVSHYLDEVLNNSDAIAVFRNGECVRVMEDIAALDSGQLAELMVGRPLAALYPKKHSVPSDAHTVLDIRQLQHAQHSRPISFAIRAGEIIGIGGIVGAGKEHLIDMIVGAVRPQSGSVSINGRRIRGGSLSAAVHAGIAYVPRDRRRLGLIQHASLERNLSLPRIRQLSRFGIVRKSDVAKSVQSIIETLHIVPGDAQQLSQLLSGGNQQKVVVGRWIGSGAPVLILEDPTVGVDIGAKADIYQLISRLAHDGIAILISSSDFAELAGVCNTVILLRKGIVASTVEENDLSEQHLLSLASDASKSTS